MVFRPSSWKSIAGQNDVPLTLHVPMVYENVPASTLHWEYRVLSVDTREEELLDEARLNELGTQGWMLVSVLDQRQAGSGSRVHYYFVRQQEA